MQRPLTRSLRPGAGIVLNSLGYYPRPMDPDLSRVDALCQTYGYPDAVRSLLHEVTTAVVVDGVRSVVLSGSGSRGELIYSTSHSGLRWFSDLDLTVVADSFQPADVAGIEKRIAVLEERQLAVGARTFHIDVVFASTESWQQPRQNFQSWETRHSGWILFGEDVLDQIRVEVDSRTCVESSLNRLWHTLLYLPEGVLRGQPSDADRQVFHYILDRAMLDFPLWLLLEQGELVPGFAGREQYFEQHCEEFASEDFEPRELLKLVREALEGRAAPDASRSLADHYRVVLRWYVLMLRRSLDRADIDESNLPQTISQERTKIYPAIGAKRTLWELKLALEIALGGRPLAALRWIVASKQVKITGFLWAMHLAAQSILSRDHEVAGSWLQRATIEMQILWPQVGRLTEDGELADRWIELRRRFFDFVVEYYRGLQPKRSYYDFVLGERRS